MASGGAGPYGSVIAEHFRRPRNQGPLPDATASAEAVNPLCGDRIRMAVVIDAGSIVEARFVANACAICIAAASLLTEHVRGMSPNDVAGLGDDSIVALVGAVPPGRTRCATLPMEALRRALAAA
jgi:nitrogen fixation protein NifU and related proteins